MWVQCGPRMQKILPVGAFVEGELYLSWVLFPSPFLPFILYSSILLSFIAFCSRANKGTLP
jgi:hypothetical protein